MNKDKKQFKIVLLGDQGVGKTSIANVFVKNEFNSYENATSGANYHAKSIVVDGHNLAYSIWDTAGQEKFRSIARLYYRDANAAILVYDVTTMKSFSMISTWIHELNENNETAVKFIVGNKIDQIEKEEVGYDVAKQLSDNYGCFLMFVSAKEKTGIQELFDMIGKELLKQEPPDIVAQRTSSLQMQKPQPLVSQEQLQQQQETKGCC